MGCESQRGGGPAGRLSGDGEARVRSARASGRLLPCAEEDVSVRRVAANELEQCVVSKTYPCPECEKIRLDKTIPMEVEVDRPFDYHLRITNLTGRRVNGIVVTEELPDNFELTDTKPTARRDANNLVWEIDSLKSGAGMEITVSGIAPEIERLKYCTQVVMAESAACASIQVVQPRLKLTKIAPGGAFLCELIPVELLLTNTGTKAAQGVRIIDTLPEGLQTAEGENELIITVGTLLAGQSRQFSTKLKATRTGEFVNKAVASSSDGHESRAEATITVVDGPVLAISQSGPDKQYAGSPLTYEITLTNESEVPAKNAVIENDIPADVTSIKATAGARLVDKKIVWPLGTLGPKASETVRVSFTPTKAGTLTNKVTASALCAESVTASTETILTAIPAVLLEVGDISDPVKIGDQTTYEIVVTNQGTAPSTNISIVCTLEDNVQYVSSTGETDGVMEDGVLKFAPLATLAPKAKATWRVVIAALKAGDTRFTVTMEADELGRPVKENEATRVYE